MKNKSVASTWIIARMIAAASVVVLGACAGMSRGDYVDYGPAATPTVDYVESLDVYSAPHKDSFLNQLAMNYRSYAIYNARTSGYADMGELFAQKAVAAFSGELPFPETLSNWPVNDEQTAFELNSAYNELMTELQNDASDVNPELAAEAQAKFDCWLSATASNQMATARECKSRFRKTMTALRDCQGGKIVKTPVASAPVAMVTESETTETIGGTSNILTTTRTADTQYYPETRTMTTMRGTGRAREGVIIVNNVNVPEHLINPVPVQPMVFNQNIYGGDKSVANSGNYSVSDSNNVTDNRADNSNRADNRTVSPWQQAAAVTPVAVVEEQTVTAGCPACSECSTCSECTACGAAPTTVTVTEQVPVITDDLVTREEFINMMMAMRAELQAINARLDKIEAAQTEKTMIKVQQIPLEPTQHIMEEVFEIHFDFDKATIKPEYQDLIRKLVDATQSNKNIKVSVVGHTDTSGSKDYNYSLGGRRAEAVQNLLIKYGIPASQIVAVSAGEEGLKVPTPDGVRNAENRRVRVVKEIYSTEEAPASGPIAIEITE